MNVRLVGHERGLPVAVRIQQTNNTAIKAWKVSWHDGQMSRSKAIRDHDDALTFKRLVEDAGEVMPAIRALDENGLLQYADWVSPAVFIQLEKILDVAKDDQEAVRAVRNVLHLALDLPR
jgi:hypothetical protein